jgi:fructose-bisphosphate aldolase class II
LRFDILEAIMQAVPELPLVLHGASGVPEETVKKINAFGGNMPGAVGIPNDQLRRAAGLGVCKINVASDLRITATAAVRELMAHHPEKFDPREYLKPARAQMKELVRHKLRHVLGSAGKA